jgi:hypothetical protein
MPPRSCWLGRRVKTERRAPHRLARDEKENALPIHNLAGYKVFADRSQARRRCAPSRSQLKWRAAMSGSSPVLGNANIWRKLEQVPSGKFRDQVDASTGAFTARCTSELQVGLRQEAQLNNRAGFVLCFSTLIWRRCSFLLRWRCLWHHGR